MAPEVVEVIARFGTTILDVAYIGATDTYRIGDAPDVDVAVLGHTRFALVEGGVMRCPVGVATHQQDNSTELCIAGVTFVVTRCKLTTPAIARPWFDWRPIAFAVASLLVHVAIWLVAITVAPFERLVVEHQPRLRYVHVANIAEPEPVPAKPLAGSHQQQREPAPSPVRQRTRVSRASAAERLSTISHTARDIAASAANARVAEHLGALRPEDNFTEDDTYTEGFGGRRRMGPGETIKTAEGYDLMLYDVKLCPARSCTIDGPIPAAFIRAQLHEHMRAIYACYRDHASGPGTVVLEFTIKGDGSVHDTRGRGLGDTGPCVARVLPEIYFKAIGDNDVADGQQKETFVRYPLQFN